MTQQNGRSATDDLTVGILRVDPTRRLAYCNAAARALLGPVSGRPAFVVDFGPAGSRIDELVERAQQDRSPVVEREMELPSGLVDLVLSPEPTADGDCGILVEIISLRWHASAWAERQAASLQAALQQMLRGLAHELKNPLGGLRGAAQLLKRRVSDPELEDFCRVIVREADRLAELVDRYAVEADMQRVPVNVHAAMERVYQLVSGNDEVTVLRDYDPSIPEIDANLDGLIQAVLNLVNNAVEAGAGRIVLKTRIRRRGPEIAMDPAPFVALEVLDDGPGVDPALGTSILYPMVTGHASGSGLGLTVVQAIAARHGGRLDFDSRPGKTAFTIYLPLEPSHG
ncbi:MAG: ATP-binding protein [Pseudomonadota bacterium]